MDDFTTGVLKLFHKILDDEIARYSVKNKSICSQIEVMKEVYSSKSDWEKDQVSKVVDYNDPAARCAYLHKYVMCYTGMVNYLLSTAVMDCSLLSYLNGINKLKICSLGGGPGTDIVGILNVFTKFFGFKLYDVCVIDQKEDWEKIFSFVISELRSSYYGNLSTAVIPNYFKYYYMKADLLSTPLNMNVKQAVSNSNFISMIKFISAAACNTTKQLVNDVFSNMKCGAVILYIDNAAGGFLQMLQKEANQCGMISIHGPLAHFEYINPAFSLERFGYYSQSKTKVSMQIWMKGFSQQIHNQHILLANLMSQQCLDNRPRSFDLVTRKANPRLHRNQKRRMPYDLNQCHLSANPRRKTFQDSCLYTSFDSDEDTLSSEEPIQDTSANLDISPYRQRMCRNWERSHPYELSRSHLLANLHRNTFQVSYASFNSEDSFSCEEFTEDTFPENLDISPFRRRMCRNWERSHPYELSLSHSSANLHRNTFQDSRTSFGSEDSFASEEFIEDGFSSDRFIH